MNFILRIKSILLLISLNAVFNALIIIEKGKSFRSAYHCKHIKAIDDNEEYFKRHDPPASYETEKILEKIGQGGDAAVFKTMVASKPLAVKRILRSTFVDSEIQIALDLQGVEGVVRIEFCEISDDYIYIYQRLFYKDMRDSRVMEKFRLKSLIARSEIYETLLKTLIDIHSKQIVHRDIKLENLFAETSTIKRLFIGDFGISKKSYSDVLRQGSPLYMPPEVRGKYFTKANPKADSFSLIVCFAALELGAEILFSKKYNDCIEETNQEPCETILIQNISKYFMTEKQKYINECGLIATNILFGILINGLSTDPSKRNQMGKISENLKE
jgi:serine/threonine protein kinase